MRWLGLVGVMLFAGCGAHQPCSARGIFCAGVMSFAAALEVSRQTERSDRIMGEPDTVEATHALAESPAWWDDGNAELIQPGDECVYEQCSTGESAGELTEPAPGH